MRFPVHDSITIKFVYTNHRGELSKRTVTPNYFTFAETPYHKPAQWIMYAYDHDKKAVRGFAMKSMESVRL